MADQTTEDKVAEVLRDGGIPEDQIPWATRVLVEIGERGLLDTLDAARALGGGK